MSSPRIQFALLGAMTLAIGSVGAQDGTPRPNDLVPEQMWYAPTAADWQKPVPACLPAACVSGSLAA
jgi:hypothetical protein